MEPVVSHTGTARKDGAGTMNMKNFKFLRLCAELHSGVPIFNTQADLKFRYQLIGCHDSEKRVQGIFPVKVQALGVGLF